MKERIDDINVHRHIPLILFCLFLIYGTLYPFSGWQWPDGNLKDLLIPSWPRHISRSDLIENFLIYIPLGLLIARSIAKRLHWLIAVALTTTFGIGLSFLLECFQIFLPSRVSSLLDVVINGAGTFAGALLSVTTGGKAVLGKKMIELRQKWFLPGSSTDLGLIVLALWALSQLSPLVPSLDLGNLKNGIKPLWYTVHDLSRFLPHQAATYALNITGLGIITTLAIKQKECALPLFAAFVTIVLFFKIPVVGRQLSLEALSGFGVGLILCVLLRRLSRLLLVSATAVAILAAFIIAEVYPDATHIEKVYRFNWTPFGGHMSNIMGLVDILEGIWPFTALAYLTLLTFPSRISLATILGGLFIFILVFVLEWVQQTISGRYPDITDALIALIGWIVPLVSIDIHATEIRSMQLTGPPDDK
jgi:VanZ family protein